MDIFYSDKHKYLLKMEWDTSQTDSQPIWHIDSEDLDIIREKHQGDLSKVLIVGARVMYISNPTSVKLGVKISDFESENYQNMENPVSVIIYAGEEGRKDLTIREADHYSQYLIKEFGDMTREKLEKQVAKLPDTEDSLISKSSQIYKMMYMNQSALNIDISIAHVIRGEYIQIPNKFIETCLDELDKNMLQQLPFVNLETLSATLICPDDRDWVDIKDTYTYASNYNSVKMELELTSLVYRQHGIQPDAVSATGSSNVAHDHVDLLV